jgi:hypothetical protein
MPMCVVGTESCNPIVVQIHKPELQKRRKIEKSRLGRRRVWVQDTSSLNSM